MKILAAIALAFLAHNLTAATFNPADWDVRCWDFSKRLWTDQGIDKMTIVHGPDSTKVINTSGIHKHAHLVFPAKLTGDFTFTIELKGGYELGWLNRNGKDEMLYLELGEANKFETFEIKRTGTRFTITRNGRPRSVVHHKFDYGQDALITLAIKQGDIAEIKSYRLNQSRSD